jgi:hypothetical protein
MAATFAPLAPHRRDRPGADRSPVFLAHLPLGVKPLGRHTQLTVAVLVNQMLLSGRNLLLTIFLGLPLDIATNMSLHRSR